ncbi:MAG: amino acid-binding protein [Lentisphaerae bacterium]|nr:amino acid-binding protein [Lentisphaerota bacterium]
MKVARVDTWAATIKDKPGGLSAKLEALAAAGANLEFVIARRKAEKPGKGVVFVTPIKGAAQCRAAKKAGFRKSKSLHTLRVEGADKKGAGAKITQSLAAGGVNLRGLSAAAIGRKFIAHIAVDTAAAATQAGKILRKM